MTINSNFRGIRSLGVFDTTASNKVLGYNIKTANITSDNIQSINYNTETNTIVHPSIVINGTYTVNTSGATNYIVVFDLIDNSTNNINFTVNANTSSASIGDRVVLMFKISNPTVRTVNMTLGSQFYYTFCGGSSSNVSLGSYERYVIEFIYDGEKYVNTYDNC